MNSVLVISTNWIGDAVMSMPALQLFREQNPDTKITMLTKPSTKALWELHPAVDEIQMMNKPFETAKMLRCEKYDCAFVLPNSLRSGAVPMLAGIPKRIGFRGHWRGWTLSRIVKEPEGHQQFEIQAILGVEGELPPPKIKLSRDAVEKVKMILGDKTKTPLITLLPGAARGPSKRWPPENFVELAKKLQSEQDARVVLSGGPDDAESCEEMAKEIGGEILNLTGKTSIAEWAALLSLSDCVVANDSGGMHLATAVGTPVVGIFGITDPAKTGPLGKSVVLQKSEVRSRSVARESDAAIEALRAVNIGDVYDAVKKSAD